MMTPKNAATISGWQDAFESDADFLFYGCNLALFLRSISSNILLVEAGEALMTRASRF